MLSRNFEIAAHMIILDVLNISYQFCHTRNHLCYLILQKIKKIFANFNISIKRKEFCICNKKINAKIAEQ